MIELNNTWAGCDEQRRKDKEWLRGEGRKSWMLLDSSLCCGSSCCHFSIRRHRSHLGLSEDRWQEEWEAAAPGLCWRELPRVKVTGAESCSPGAPDTPQQLPLRDAASAHLFTGSGTKKKISEAQRSSVSFLSHHAVTLFCYSCER